MRPLVLLWSCLVLPGYEALKGPKEVSGFEGDKVSLRCTYEKNLRGHRKYWCRQGGIMVSRCTDIVYTSQNQEVAQGRMSIRDNPRELSMTVTMRDLTLKDAGKYWCGIDRLGFDESFEVSLIVFPAFPGLQPTVVTAQQGKTGVEAPGFTEAALARPAGTSQVLPGTSPYAGSPPHTASPAWPAGTSPPPGTSPYAGSSPHTATSPHAGSSRPALWLPPTTPKDSKAITRGVSKSSVSIPMVRMLASVWVLLSLVLAAALIAFGSHMLRGRKKAWLATETQRNEKVYPPASPPGNNWVPEDTMINLAAPPECLSKPKPSAAPSMETQHLSQTTEEEAAPSPDAKEDVTAASPLQMSAEELAFSEFIPV
ncbi:CMRF35-like molecule 9 isoform X2 [Peromyscus leucopus]|uniref:CMRF35-like molecule 9 isoform X2 n=1 Tax=Peromyscus leucopus TaxID=10041 RepID=UPI0010A11B7C|nr:CMRF35-like molecule 9 isoform X2 [Peromyscus leucopus]